jgi:hypothetical protein
MKKIDWLSLKNAYKQYCSEYKGSNWVLSNRTDILFANDTSLWDKVDETWC